MMSYNIVLPTGTAEQLLEFWAYLRRTPADQQWLPGLLEGVIKAHITEKREALVLRSDF
jgi:hypothetical protein